MSTPTNESLGTSHIDPSKFMFVQADESRPAIVDKTSDQAIHIGNLSQPARGSILQKHSYRELTPRDSSGDQARLDEWIASLPPEIQNAHRETIPQRGATVGTSREPPPEPADGPPPIPGTMELPPPIPGTLQAPIADLNSLRAPPPIPQGKTRHESDVPGAVNKSDYQTTYLGTQENIDELRGRTQRVDKWVRANPTPLSSTPQRSTKPQLPNDIAMQTRAAQMMAGVQQNREEAQTRKQLMDNFEKQNIEPLKENKGRLEKEIGKLQHEVKDLKKRLAIENFQWHLAQQRREVVDTKVENPTLSEKIASKESEIASKRGELGQVDDMIRLQKDMQPHACKRDFLLSKTTNLDNKLKTLRQEIENINLTLARFEPSLTKQDAAQARSRLQIKENEAKQIDEQLSSAKKMLFSTNAVLMKLWNNSKFADAR